MKHFCSGTSASWCPIHGQCTCSRDEFHGDFIDGMSDDDCPLHRVTSAHGLEGSDVVYLRALLAEVYALYDVALGVPDDLWDRIQRVLES